jgi:hypothetical protein
MAAWDAVFDAVVKGLTGAAHLVNLAEKGWGYFRDWMGMGGPQEGMNADV